MSSVYIVLGIEGGNDPLGGTCFLVLSGLVWCCVKLNSASSTSLSPGPTSKARGVSVGPGVKLEPWSIVVSSAGKTGNGPGVKHLARIASRPVTWVIKIKHAGLGVLGQKNFL